MDQWLTEVAPARTETVEQSRVRKGELPWGHPEGWPLIPSGRGGSMRSTSPHMLQGVETDLEAVMAWFIRKRAKSPHTLAAYRKEVGRLLLWAADQGKALSDLGPADYIQYETFLANPEPAERWIGRGRRFGIGDPRWRPFSGPLSPRSRRQAMRIIEDLIRWLASDAMFLRGNPLSLVHTGSEDADPGETSHFGGRRHLSPVQWDAIRETINAGETAGADGELRKLRAKLLFTLLYLYGLRISAVRGHFGDIYETTVGERRVLIWPVMTKGKKRLRIPLTEEVWALMSDLREKIADQVPDHRAEDLAIIPRLRGDPREPLGRAALHEIVKQVVWSASDRLLARGERLEADGLRNVSAHWLRHTAATVTLQAGVDLSTTAELLGHADVRTTQGYTHKEALELLEALTARGQVWG